MLETNILIYQYIFYFDLGPKKKSEKVNKIKMSIDGKNKTFTRCRHYAISLAVTFILMISWY